MKIKIKPLPTNALHKGTRYSSKEYLVFEKELYYQLPSLTVPKDKICLNLVFGLSSTTSDLDNCLKGTIDVLAKKYQFNDKQVSELHVFKEIVKNPKDFMKKAVSVKLYTLEIERIKLFDETRFGEENFIELSIKN